MLQIFYIIFEWLLGLTTALIQVSRHKKITIPNLTLRVKKLYNSPYTGSGRSDIYLGRLIFNGSIKLVRASRKLLKLN
jgi:hypothetical protein